MSILTEEQTRRIPPRALRELIRGEHAAAEFAIYEQRQIKAAMEAAPLDHHLEGAGRKILTLGREQAARLRVRHGVSCLSDPDFLRSLVKKNPFLRPRYEMRKLSLRVDGLRDSSSCSSSSSSSDSRRSDSRTRTTDEDDYEKGNERSAGRVGHAAQSDPAPPRATGSDNRRGVATPSAVMKQPRDGVSLVLPEARP